MKKIILILFILIVQFSFGQMITKSSYLEDTHGKKIDYSSFVEKWTQESLQ